MEAIADPRFALNVLVAFGALDLFAQRGDQNAQILWLVFAGWTPDGAQENLVREHLAGRAREEQKQIEFLRCEVNGCAPNRDGVCVGVDLEVSYGELRFRRLSRGQAAQLG